MFIEDERGSISKGKYADLLHTKLEVTLTYSHHVPQAFCIKGLRHVRENECHSRLPHVFGTRHSHELFFSYVCDATWISINIHEFVINIYETFVVINVHLCDAVGKEGCVRLRGWKCEGNVRENECPSRALNPLYIGLWDPWCEYVRHIFDFLIFSYGKAMSDAFETCSDAFETRSDAFEIRKRQMHGAKAAFG